MTEGRRQDQKTEDRNQKMGVRRRELESIGEEVMPMWLLTPDS